LSPQDIDMAVLVISATASVNGCEATIEANFGWTCVEIPPGCCEENLYISNFQFTGCNTVEFSGDITNLSSQISNSWTIVYNHELPGSNTDYYLDIDNNPQNLNQPSVPVFSGPGLYTLFLENNCGQNSNGDDCIQDVTREALLPFVQDFTYELVCTSNNTYDLRLYDNSEYAENFGVDPSNVHFTWTVNGLPVSGYGMTYFEYTLGLFPGQPVNVSLSLSHFYNGWTYGPNICPPVTMSFQIPELPDAQFNIENDYSCLDQILTFSTVQDVNEVGSVLWDFDDGSQSRKNPVDKVYLNSGQYNITLEVTDTYGCIGSHTESLTIVDNSINGSLSYNMEGSCDAMAKLIFTPDSQNPLPIVDYTWSTGDNTGNVNEVMITQSGVYTVTVTDADGCTEVFESSEIILQDAFASDLNVSNNGCGTKQIYFSVKNGYEYLIHFNKDNGASSGFTTNTNFTLSGTYIVTVYVFNFSPVDNSTDLSLACAYDHVSFDVVELPKKPNLNSGSLDCDTESISVDITNSFDLNQYSINWSGPGIVNATNVFSITAFSNGTYGVTVTDDATGCTNDRSIEVTKAAPDLSGMITGCYTTCEVDGLLEEGILTSPVSVDVGNWSWNLDGNVIISGMSTVPSNLSLNLIAYTLDQEHKITFIYEIDGCVFESEPFCLTCRWRGLWG